MIRRVRGRLAGAAPVEVLTEGGVGYEVSVPVGLPLPEVGGEVELHTVLVPRDDAWELYGFADARDRELFQRLRKPSGVGPRLALAILGSLSGARVVAAIRGKDHAALRAVSGVGRKTAERLVIELSDKLDDLGYREAAGGEALAVQALRRLGYSAAVSEEAVRRAVEEGGDASPEALVRRALRLL